jgi:hypothetical protein
VTQINVKYFSYIPCGESTVKSVLGVNDIETTDVLLTVYKNTRTSHITTASREHNVAGLKVDEVDDLVLLKVKLDSVVNLDSRVGVTDGATIVGEDVGNTLGTDCNLLHLEKLEGSLLRGDAVDGETTLHVVKYTEMLSRLLDGNDVCFLHLAIVGKITTYALHTHEASGVGVVSADLVVHLDQSLLGDAGDLITSDGVLEAVAEEDCEWEGLAELVRTGGRARSLDIRVI